MLSIENLSVEFGGFTLLDNISFVLNRNERVALTGKNGAGKSTLLKIMAGLQKPTKGNVSVPKDATIGYLPQQMKLNDSRTVFEEASLAFDHLKKMERDLEYLHNQLAERTDYESEAYHKIIERATDLQELLQMSGIHNFEAEIEKTLLGLGFKRADFNRPTGEFSGGWRMRIELAKILLQAPDVLLLDEPTNHLDIESIQWLENFLSTHANAVMLVSHDRAFLDAVTNRTIEILLGDIHDYKVNYSRYVELRKERREQQIRAFENQQKQIKDTEEFIERFRYKPTKSNQVQSRIKQLEKIERIEIDEVDNSRLNLKFPPSPRSGSYPVIMEDISKSYGDHLVFKNVTLTIERGEKIAFVGKNGEGKSTLVKCIMNEIDFEGNLTHGHNVKIGYFAQNQAQMLNEERTVFETIDDVAVGDIRTKIRDILGAFMFGGEASDKKVKVLSGGERSRLAMIRLLLEPVNLLILDEPTNHLDLASKDVLKKAIREFDGTAIIVSHDRDFLDGLVNKVYEFGGGRVTEHIGGIYDYLSKKKLESLQQLELSVSTTQSSDLSEKAEQNTETSNKLSYLIQKEQNRKQRKLEREIEEVEDNIENLENEISTLEAELATPEGAADTEKLQKYLETKKQLEGFMSKWEKLTLELENFIR
ncbi:MAG: ABC-F family ATP-binding cassette domain-containing protein [Fermentimonas sp.]|jgi:ATP-binding cassette subfamily F protein 3|uniref:ABC-F family ATP-binding cassette domain-containing protein n=1 Tax=Lascolabacillus sp. TaxID=1924068 RepID=UPI000A946224|nr:ABC-F family ATP-binding cassette domain-containing protein [Lascolabacillus sp.]MBP6174951.1 ABC-F family ATP-binding cassette domain-containing protein [Fermentimonas sp.]MDI9625172.1 ABC-F family ATP-binding cassette domain-containing protein [Bacteroidota bacterium]TAH61767.1 MAG: ABC transporter ATP-binding protein [Fermentimonas caenicola]MBP6197296.1 ABC-F family ATP-binding cassette domain-containing protein [Fermentimonas sp.]MBP7104925.1 ABC-F family ATP-binding cassette domain-co